MTVALGPVIPVLRMFDLDATKRFYVDYLGCTLDWEDGEGDRPVYLQISRGELVLHLSSHHDDGTPGGAVLVEIQGLDALHAELREQGYPYLNPGIEPGPGEGRQMELIDPSSNRLRFYERPTSAVRASVAKLLGDE
jgi:extradiol dioxygenase family protein